VVVNGPELKSYWPSFFLWLTAVVLLGGMALRELWLSKARDLGAWWAANRMETGIVTGLTLAAAAVRLIGLAGTPWPFTGDESALLMQGFRVTEGDIRNMFASGFQGHPTAYFFSLSGLTQVLGDSIFVARLYGATLGIAVVPAVYLLLRRLFDRNVAFAGGAFVVTYHVAVHFSRQDMNNIGDTLVLAVVALLLWRALTSLRPADYVLTGLVAGLGLYVYAGCRVAVPVIAVVCLISLVQRRDTWRAQVSGIVLMSAAYLVAGGPLLYFWFENPHEFSNRIDIVGIYQSGWIYDEIERTGRSEMAILLDQALRSFGAFGFYSDVGPHYRGPMPAIDHLALPFFLLGAAIALVKLRELRYQVLVVLFVIVVVTGGMLTTTPPNVQRVMATVPVSAALIGVGLVTATQAIARRTGPQVFMPLTVLLVSAIAAYNLQYYFLIYAPQDFFSDFNTRIATRAVEYTRSLPPETRVYWLGAPALFASHPTFRYEGAGLRIYEVPEGAGMAARPLEGEGPAVFLIMRHRREERDFIMQACPGGQEGEARHKERRFMFWTYAAPAETHCALPTGPPATPTR
jgi:4-amino-4-deoxy-L-arabinose transferase-like glycosyltransferase